MQYSIIVYEDEAGFAMRTEADAKKQQEYWESWHRYSQMLAEAGVMAGGAGLEPPEVATSIRLSGNERQVQDGPYIEAKEQLGGIFIIDVPDLDAALDWAAKCPSVVSGMGGAEVRPNLVGPK
ncbi:MAG: YciI family protein [Pseudomonadota bacterium]